MPDVRHDRIGSNVGGRTPWRRNATLWLLLFGVFARAGSGLVADGATVTLAWDPPAGNVDGTPLTDLGGYKVWYGTASRTYSTAMDVGPVKSAQVQNLATGVRYFFAVTCYNKAGYESGYSSEVTFLGLPRAETPAVRPSGGTLAVPTRVTLTCRTAGATIHYTVDGTEPTVKSPVGTSLWVQYTTTVKAMAVKAGYGDSAVAVAVLNMRDTDRDQLPDWVETGTGHYTSATDTGTSPSSWDSDSDRIGDGLEVVRGWDPNNKESGTRRVVNDFDGDGKSDIGCYYAQDGEWYLLETRGGFVLRQFGYDATVPITGDFDGDGKTDYGCYSAAGGHWFMMKSTEGFATWQFGYEGTVPVVGDFDDDGRTDYGCYSAAGGHWFLMKSTEGFATWQFGYEGTVPVVGDFDGDGRTDSGCYSAASGDWFLMKSREGFSTCRFGGEGTVPVVGDFDGDGKSDYGCYSAAGGNWSLMKSREGFATWTFGYEGTVPVLGDYDGDGRTDYGCYEAAGGNWYLMESREGFVAHTFGFAGTIALGSNAVRMTP